MLKKLSNYKLFLFIQLILLQALFRYSTPIIAEALFYFLTESKIMYVDQE